MFNSDGIAVTVWGPLPLFDGNLITGRPNCFSHLRTVSTDMPQYFAIPRQVVIQEFKKPSDIFFSSCFCLSGKGAGCTFALC